MATSAEWLHKIANFRVYKAKGGPAPYKALLLLVLLEDVLPLTPELAFRFCTSWNIVAQRGTQRPDVRLPFHHLQRDGLWPALGEDGKPSPDDRLTRSAALVSDFVGFANDPANRDKAKRILIAKYFPPDERLALYALVGLPVPKDEESALDAAYQPPTKPRNGDARLASG